MGQRTLWNWLSQPLRRGSRPRGARRAGGRPLCLETLESRLTPVSTLSVADATYNLAADAAGYTVTRSGDLTPAVNVSYSVTDGTALAGTNYTAAPTGIVHFASGSAMATIPLTILPDNFSEASRTFTVDLISVVDTFGPTATFAARNDLVGGTTPYSVATADLNGDGLADLLVANSNDDTVSVRFNTTTPGQSPSFGAEQIFAAGSFPNAVTTADINGDGRPDLLVSSRDSNAISVLVNTTTPGSVTATFAPASIGVGYGPRSVAAADVNGDGKIDLLVGNANDDTVSVLMNTTPTGDATATFAPQSLFAVISYPSSVATADINGDGRPDLLVANRNSNSVSALINLTLPGDAVPTFSAQTDFAVGISPRSMLTADVNGDGKADLLTANYGSDTASVLLNTTTPGAATPTFAAAVDFATGAFPFSATTSDVNGDGLPDLLVANYGSDTVSVLLNITAPGATAPLFAPQSTIAAGDGPFSVAATDLNGDGKADILVTNSADNTISVLMNTTSYAEATAAGVPNPTFIAAGTSATGTRPRAVTVVDVNGDGRLDLITANSTGNTISVMLNTTTPGGATTFATQQTFATGTTPRSVVAADLNGDGLIDLLVSNQGPGSVSVFMGTMAPGATTAVFATRVDFAIGADAFSMVAEDVNGDGRADILATNLTAGTVSVRLNTTVPGAAVPTFATAVAFTVGNNPISLVTADINGDGRLDLIASNRVSNTLSVLMNTTVVGALVPTFATQVTFTTGVSPIYVSAADLNGDGKIDLFVPNAGAGTVSVFLNTTAPGAAVPTLGTMQSVVSAGAGSTPVTVKASDLNGDGTKDLVVTNYLSATVTMLLNTTAPGATTLTFAPATEYSTGAAGPAGARPLALAIADVSGDGRPDLLVSNYGDANVLLLLNTPAVLSLEETNATGTIDSAPVVLTFVRADASPTNAATVNFTVTFSEAVSGLSADNFSLTGTASAGAIGTPTSSDGGITWNVPVTTADDGTIGLTLDDRAGIVDSVGNQLYNTTSDDGSIFLPVVGPEYTIDQTAPTTEITNKPPAFSNSSSAAFSFTATDPTVNDVSTGVDYTETNLDAAGFVTAESPQTYSGLAEGNHTFEVRAVDNVGNVGETTSYTWMIDLTNPTAAITAMPPLFSNSTTATFSFTGTDPLSSGVSSGVNRLETNIDGAGYVTQTSSQTLTGLAEGAHTFQVRSIDNAGNVSSVESYTWTIDITVPTATITSNPDNPTNSTSATFTFTGVDPLSGGVSSGIDHFETVLDGTVFVTQTSPQSFTGLAEGSHTFQVRAVDNAGNVGEAASFTWIVDVTDPTTEIATKPPLFSNSASATFTFTGTDPVSGGVSSGVDYLETNLDGAGFVIANSPQTFSGLAEGSHTFQVRATDLAGNVGEPQTYTWTVDLTVPTVAITANPPALSNSTSATFSFTGTDPVSGGVSSGINRLETRLDGAEFATAGSPQSFTGLSEGNHTFQVLAIDNAGNISEVASYAWTIDITAPTTEITSSPPSVTNSTSATFTFTGTDPVSGGVSSGVAYLETELDGVAFTTNTSPQTFTGLAEGSHSFQVRAVDSAGNVGPATLYTWIVDVTAPIATITGNPPNPSSSSAATFTFSGADPVSSGVSSGVNRLETSLDGATFVTATSPQTFAGLSESSHTFQVRAIDNAGNIGAAASYTWTVVVPTIVFLDLNANGIQDAGDPGLANRTMFLDLNADGQLTPGESFDVSAADGSFTLDGPGTLTQALFAGDIDVSDAVATRMNTSVAILAASSNLYGGGATADEGFVLSLYRAILGREAEPGGVNSWVAELQSGATREEVATAIWTSEEHRTAQIEGYYRDYLGRTADANGLLGWQASFAAGATEEQVVTDFLMSAEYLAAHPSDSEFVEGLYAALLGRDRHDGESPDHEQTIATQGRQAVVASVLNSTEARARAIDNYYVGALNRQGDAAGQQSWLSEMSRLTYGDVAIQFFVSAEFAAKSAT